MYGGSAAPAGALGLRVFRTPAHIIDGPFWHLLRQGLPHLGLSWEVFWWRCRNLRHLARGAWKVLMARLYGLPVHYGALWLRVLRADGTIVDLGLASLRVVTTAGVNAIRDAFLNTFELENLKFHGLGTGTTAEAVGDTALVTELTTQYQTDNTRPTGSQVSQGAGIYRTVGTITVDAAVAATEHGIFSQAATGGGTLLDRSVFSVVNLASGDSLQGTYDFTATAGS